MNLLKAIMITTDCNRTKVILTLPFAQGGDSFVSKEGIFQDEFAGEVVRPVLLPANVVVLCQPSAG